MLKLAGLLLAVLSSGVAATVWWYDAAEESVRSETTTLTELNAAIAQLEDRIAVLESAPPLGPLPDAEAVRLASAGDGVEPPPDAMAVAAADPETLRRARFAGMSPGERRRARMLDAGLSPQTVDWIRQRETELQLESLAQNWERQRQRYLDGEPLSPGPAAALRAELNELDYEAYRRALGLPTSATVLSVFDGATASQAGLQPGDRIVRYDGERLYDLADLQALSVQGPAGETVTLDIERDGVPLQVAVPRGPLGVRIGRR